VVDEHSGPQECAGPRAQERVPRARAVRKCRRTGVRFGTFRSAGLPALATLCPAFAALGATGELAAPTDALFTLRTAPDDVRRKETMPGWIRCFPFLQGSFIHDNVTVCPRLTPSTRQSGSMGKETGRIDVGRDVDNRKVRAGGTAINTWNRSDPSACD
jgi:hypothetical protein